MMTLIVMATDELTKKNVSVQNVANVSLDPVE